ncbi:AraC-type DNA-binding protein [Flavobacterium chilense]|uniref:AraC-type DNA-binding protein n=2 Tax=Flavobacterium chilense TaxID=946677 RepID=A0A1M6XTC4_9FLAO|nr:AraC-type DNA-binding protein [Flavobacterium chilense]
MTNISYMKKIEHFYGADLSWVEHFAQQYGGKVEGNFIIGPDDILSGTRYFYNDERGITVLYIDVEYKKDVHFIQKNINKDFVGLYYNLTEGEAMISGDDYFFDMGRWQYNLAAIDGSLESHYKVKAGSKTFALCIFIKKSNIEKYAKNNNIVFTNLDKIVDPAKNTIIRFDRMSNESFHLLEDLKKLTVGNEIFNLNLIGTAHLLMSNYLKKIASKRIILQTVNDSDLESIINIQMFLIEHIKEQFPHIQNMAKKANMSESKFKTLFKKITGETPNVFFMSNKLLLAKEMLEKKQLTVSQISDQLSFKNQSYFSTKFKEYFGVSPTVFLKQL